MSETLRKPQGHLIHTVEVIIGKVKNPHVGDETWARHYPLSAHGAGKSTGTSQASREHAPCRT